VLQAIYSTIQLIADHPEAAPRTDSPEVRVALVRRYGYRIFYTIANEAIQVLHVRHASRQPWTGT
jgi:plasmid stabilization system protein ParE